MREKRGNISVEEATEKILSYVNKIEDTEMVSLQEAAGRILAEDAAAEFDNPPFDKSPIDGYACRWEDTEGASEEKPVMLRVTKEIDAGGYSETKVKVGEAVRIMTGAAIPPGCNCCIRQENTDYGEETVAIYQSAGEWENYCFAGEDFKEGELLLKRGTRITYIEQSILAGMGKARVKVFRLPRIVVLTSGDEVTEPGNPLLPGKIYNSNLTMTEARLREWNITPIRAASVEDDPSAMANELKEAVREADMIVTTGAVSVGKKDIMHEALAMIGAERVFWGVRLKPGMPTLFSVCEDVPIISLSGNPFGVAVTLELFIRPALQKMTENTVLRSVRVKGEMADTLKKGIKGRRFVRAYWENGKFYLPKGLHSNGVISSMAGCNCLIDVDAAAGVQKLEEGTAAEAILL